MKKREPTEYVIQPKGWKKRYKCHKNKGLHTFVVVHARQVNWSFMCRDGSAKPWNHLFIDHVCTACGKQHVEVVK